MEYRKLGRTGLNVSAIGLGTEHLEQSRENIEVSCALPSTRANVQECYQAALDSLVTKLKQDHYVLAAVLYGSLARGDAWEKSDIDITIIQRDGLKRESQYYWLVEDGINISASVVSRSRFKRAMEGALQGSFEHSVRSQSKLLFSKDESIEAWFEETDRISDRDQEFQLLRAGANVPPNLYKAEKWFPP